MKRLVMTAATIGGILAIGALALVGGRRSSDPDLAGAKTAEVAKSPAAVDRIREVTIPSGTVLSAALDADVSSATSRVDDPVRAHLIRPVVIGEVTAIPERSEVSGAVSSAVRSGRVKGRAHIALQFGSLRPQGGQERYDIRAATISQTAPGTKKKDALEIGIPSAGGAAIGAALGGKKGAAIGAAAGGGGGTAYVMSTRGQEVHVNRGAALSIKLLEPLTVRVHTTVADKRAQLSE